MAMVLSEWGKWLFLAGVVLVIVGGLLWLAGKAGLSLGRLPGDIYFHREGFTFYAPLTSMLLLSLLLTLILNLVLRFLRR